MTPPPPPVVPVEVTLGPPLSGVATVVQAATGERVGRELGEVLNDLGLPARPAVTVRRDPAGEPIALAVSGRPCRYPTEVLGWALGYITGTPPLTGAQVEEEWQRLAAGDSWSTDDGRVADAVALVCRAAVNPRPTVLVAGEPMAAFVAGLDLPNSTGIETAVLTAVDLGRSLADRELVRQTLAGVGPNGEPAQGDDPAERLVAALARPTVDIHVEPNYLRALTVGTDDPAAVFRHARDELRRELGIPLPQLHLVPDPALRPASFAVRVTALRGIPQVGLADGQLLVNSTPALLAQLGVVAAPTLNPQTGRPGALVTQVSEHGPSATSGRMGELSGWEDRRELLNAVGFTTWDPLGYLALALADQLRREAYTLVDRVLVSGMLDQLKKVFPKLTQLANRFVPADRVVEVLRGLLRDQIPVRNLRRILELMLRDVTEPGNPSTTADTVARIRAGLADLISAGTPGGTGTTVAYLLSPDLEALLESSGDAECTARLVAAVRAELTTLPESVLVPVVLTRDDLRPRLRALLRADLPRLVVVGYGDLPAHHRVQPVARIA